VASLTGGPRLVLRPLGSEEWVGPGFRFRIKFSYFAFVGI